MTAHEIYKLWASAAKANSREALEFPSLSQSEQEVWATFALLLRDAFRAPPPTQEAKELQ